MLRAGRKRPICGPELWGAGWYAAERHAVEGCAPPFLEDRAGWGVLQLLEQISKTYGHLLPDVLDRTRTALDSFLAAPAAEAERGTGH